VIYARLTAKVLTSEGTEGRGVECTKIRRRTNVQDEERSGRPSVLQSVDQNISERRHFTISEL
jgi:hypothetical protein